jgi:hypothetical protein
MGTALNARGWNGPPFLPFEILLAVMLLIIAIVRVRAELPVQPAVYEIDVVVVSNGVPANHFCALQWSTNAASGFHDYGSPVPLYLPRGLSTNALFWPGKTPKRFYRVREW